MNYVALICARGGSKGIPDKNIRQLGGLPLIGWAIKSALQVKRISRVIVSTDSDKIAEVASAHGAEVPFIRPAELSQDNSPEWETWRHALQFLKNNNKKEIAGLVVVPPTAPLRHKDDLENCIDEFEKGKVDAVITVSDAHRSPYFNMVRHDSLGYANLVITPNNKVYRRQDVPVVYDMTTVAYVVRPQFVMTKEGLFEGRVRSVHVPADRALDIDNELDLIIAECLLKYQKDIES